MAGIASEIEGFSEKVAVEAFKRGVIMETAGPEDEVFKLFPALTIKKRRAGRRFCNH